MKKLLYMITLSALFLCVFLLSPKEDVTQPYGLTLSSYIAQADSGYYQKSRGGRVFNHSGYVNGTTIATANQDIWGAGGNVGLWSDNGGTEDAKYLRCISSSANDDAAGTGARTLTVTGLNSSFIETTDVITMDGTTSVSGDVQFSRVNSGVITTAGTGLTNAGAILCWLKDGSTAITGAPKQIYMAIGKGKTDRAHYAVPVGKFAYITDVYASSTTEVVATYNLQTRNYGKYWQTQYSFTVSGGFAHIFASPLRVSPKADIRLIYVGADRIQGRENVGITTMDISGGFAGIVE